MWLGVTLVGLGGSPGCPKSLLDDFGVVCVKFAVPFWGSFWGSFWDMFFACFLGSPSGGHFLIVCAQEAPKLELFGSHLRAFFENMKTVIFETPHTLQACGEGPKWYLFGYFFGGCFREGLRGSVFSKFSDFGGSFGRRFFTKKGGLKKGAKKVSSSRLKEA